MTVSEIQELAEWGREGMEQATQDVFLQEWVAYKEKSPEMKVKKFSEQKIGFEKLKLSKIKPPGQPGQPKEKDD